MKKKTLIIGGLSIGVLAYGISFLTQVPNVHTPLDKTNAKILSKTEPVPIQPNLNGEAKVIPSQSFSGWRKNEPAEFVRKQREVVKTKQQEATKTDDSTDFDTNDSLSAGVAVNAQYTFLQTQSVAKHVGGSFGSWAAESPTEQKVTQLRHRLANGEQLFQRVKTPPTTVYGLISVK